MGTCQTEGESCILGEDANVRMLQENEQAGKTDAVGDLADREYLAEAVYVKMLQSEQKERGYEYDKGSHL